VDAEEKFVPKIELTSARAFKFPVGVDTCLFFHSGEWKISAHVGNIFAEEFCDFYCRLAARSDDPAFKKNEKPRGDSGEGIERHEISKYFVPFFWNLWKSKNYKFPETTDFCFMFSANPFESQLALVGK
jgi:hypothetical protein